MITTAPVQTDGLASHLSAALAIARKAAENSSNRDSEGDDQPIRQVASEHIAIEKAPLWANPNNLAA